MDDVDRIRYQMNRIRREFDQKSSKAVAHAQAMVDWRYYWRHYPWAGLAIAAGLGYLIVPQRQSASHGKVRGEALRDLERNGVVIVERDSRPAPGMLAALGTLAANTALRSALAYIGNRVSQPISPTQQPPTPLRKEGVRSHENGGMRPFPS